MLWFELHHMYVYFLISFYNLHVVKSIISVVVSGLSQMLRSATLAMLFSQRCSFLEQFLMDKFFKKESFSSMLIEASD